MKKFITLALASVILLCLPITAYADFSIPGLDIAIPEKLQEIIDSYDTSELTAAVKEKLDDVKLMSDDELFLYIKDFCVKYSVELDEEQMHKLAEYVGLLIRPLVDADAGEQIVDRDVLGELV